MMLFALDGTPGGIRTPDLLLRRQLLYPTELLARIVSRGSIPFAEAPSASGADDGNRTHVSSLEGWCSTIELHPHSSSPMFSLESIPSTESIVNSFFFAETHKKLSRHRILPPTSPAHPSGGIMPGGRAARCAHLHFGRHAHRAESFSQTPPARRGAIHSYL